MKAQFNANEFSGLYDKTAMALVRVDEVIEQKKTALTEARQKGQQTWWERLFCDNDFDPDVMRLSVDIQVRQDRKEDLEKLLRHLGFVIGQGAEFVTLSNNEIWLLSLYGKAV